MNRFQSLILALFFIFISVTHSFAKKWYVNDGATTNDVYTTSVGSLVTQSVGLTSGSVISSALSAANFAKFEVGDYVTGTGIQQGTYIVAKNVATLKLEFSLSATSTGSSTLTIYGSSTSKPVSSLKALINSGIVQDNDTIYVDAGTYLNESIIIKQNNLTVIGAGKSLTLFNSTSTLTGPLFNDLGTYSTCSTICNVISFNLSNVKIKGYKNAGAIVIKANNTVDTTYNLKQ